MTIRMHPAMLVVALGAALTIGWSAGDIGRTTRAGATQPDDFFSEDDAASAASRHGGQPDDGFFGDADEGGAMEPARHDEVIEELAGRWHVRVRVHEPSIDEPIEMEGDVERQWVLEGLWLREHLVAENDQFRYESISMVGYSPLDQTYQTISFDSVSPGVFIDVGHMNEQTDQLLSIGSYRDEETGALVHTRTRFDMSDSNRHRFVLYEVGADGDERIAVEGVYERDD